MYKTSRFWTCGPLAIMALGATLAMPAAAGTIVYNIVDYPAYEADSGGYPFGVTDTISGTIVSDGLLGSVSASDIVGGSFTIKKPEFGSITKPVLGNLSVTGSLFATSTQLELVAPSNGNTNALVLGDFFHTPFTVGNYYTLLAYARTQGGLDGFHGSVDQAIDSTSGGVAVAFGVQGNDPISLGGNDPWIIATVPEPSTLILVGIGLLGLALVCIRQFAL